MLLAATSTQLPDRDARDRRVPRGAGSARASAGSARSRRRDARAVSTTSAPTSSPCSTCGALRRAERCTRGNQLRKWCREHFLSFLRMREWHDLHAQLADRRGARGAANEIPASYADLHQAILTGSWVRSAPRRDSASTTGPRDPLRHRSGHAARVEATALGGRRQPHRDGARVRAHGCRGRSGLDRGRGSHLVKRVYTEPHWVAGARFRRAREQVTLFGLPSSRTARLVRAIDPRECARAVHHARARSPRVRDEGGVHGAQRTRPGRAAIACATRRAEATCSPTRTRKSSISSTADCRTAWAQRQAFEPWRALPSAATRLLLHCTRTICCGRRAA